MTQPSGWYDDPQDPSKLRYWDGVVWSSHVSPKVSPAVEQSTIGMPYGVIPASARAQSPGSSGAQGAPTAHDGFGSPQQGQGRPGDQRSGYGQVQGTPGQQQRGWESHPAATPDGVQLSGWWLRVAARLLDLLITGVFALPFTGWFYYRYITEVVDWSKNLAAESASGSAPVVALPPWEVLQFAFTASIIGLLVSAAYEVFFLSRSGATPGKKVVGISVRLRERAGPPSMRAVLLRVGCIFVLSVISSLAYLLDILWPLWDDKRQAIHDKVAATNVVVGPQPKRDA